MAIKIGIVGYPRAGRKTLLDAIHRVATGAALPPIDDWYPNIIIPWRSDNGVVDLEFRLLEDSASASFSGMYDIPCTDIRDALLEGGWGEYAFVSRMAGVFFVLDGRIDRFHRSARRVGLYRRDVAAAGRSSNDVPVLFVLNARGVDASGEVPANVARHGVFGSEAEVLVANARSGEGVREVVQRLVALLPPPRGVWRAGAGADARQPKRSPETTRTALLPFVPAQSADDLVSVLLEIWRQTRAPAVADLVDAAAYARRALRPAIFSHEQWIRICRTRRPEDLPFLVDTVLLHDPGAYLADHCWQVVERLDGLTWWQDDCRLTRRAGALLLDLNRYRRAPVAFALCRLLQRHGDWRAISELRQYQADFQTIRPPLNTRASDSTGRAFWAIEAMTKAEHEIGAAALIVPPEHQDAWNDLCERIRRPLPRPEDMEAIAANPHDDDLRRELAIRMQERGDPRGEFILLQLRQAAGDSLSPGEHEREQALKRTYAWDWLGPLADVVDVENCVFEKGYPVKVTVWTPNTRAINDVIGRPEWATIRELRWGGDPCWEEDEADPALVNHPVMKSLQVVTTKMPEDPAELEALRRVAWAR